MDFDTMREYNDRLIECIEAADTLKSAMDLLRSDESVDAVAPQIESDVISAMMQAREDAYRYVLFLCPETAGGTVKMGDLFSAKRNEVLAMVAASVESFEDADNHYLYIDGTELS